MKLLFVLPLFLLGSAGLISFSFYFLLRSPEFPPTGNWQSVAEASFLSPASGEPVHIPISSFSDGEDIRITSLRTFLTGYQSPLSDYVELLVETADRWGMDYAILPAIAMQETGGCRYIPENSHNCWGYGVYGGKIFRFDSYPHAISTVAKTVKESYIKDGLTNPTLVEDKWVPSSGGQWSYGVNFFIGKIRQIEKTISSS